MEKLTALARVVSSLAMLTLIFGACFGFSGIAPQPGLITFVVGGSAFILAYGYLLWQGEA